MEFAVSVLLIARLVTFQCPLGKFPVLLVPQDGTSSTESVLQSVLQVTSRSQSIQLPLALFVTPTVLSALFCQQTAPYART